MLANAQHRNGRPRNRLRPFVWGAAALLLLLPAIAMQFTSEVDWDETDFIVMGVLLFGSAGIYEVATRMSANRAYRAGVGLAVVTSFLLVWINLAVGVIGNEDNPANLMFFGVIGIAIVGSILARFRAAGLANAMFAAAAAQGLVAVITIIIGWGLMEPPGAAGLVMLILFFAVLWLLCAALFRRAAEDESRTAG